MSDLISRADAIDSWDKLSKRGRTEFDQVLMTLPSAETPIVSEKHQLSEETPTNAPTNAPTELISRQDAITEIRKYFANEIIKMPHALNEDGYDVYIDMAKVNSLLDYNKELNRRIKALPSADRPTTDCTKFLEWLKAEALDEENWELNAVANGEVICRKFRKLGWLDVEDGYYVDTRPTGEWVLKEHLWECDQCGCRINRAKPLKGNIWNYNFCPNCGAKMGGDD